MTNLVASMRPRHFCPGYEGLRFPMLAIGESFNEAEAFLPRIFCPEKSNACSSIGFNEAEAFLPRIL